jgi:hypothetical protein
MQVILGKDYTRDFTCREALSKRYAEYLMSADKVGEVEFCPDIKFIFKGAFSSSQSSKESIEEEVQNFIKSVQKYGLFPGADISYEIKRYEISYTDDDLLPTIMIRMLNYPIGKSGISFFNKLFYPALSRNNLYYSNIRSYGGFLREIFRMNTAHSLAIPHHYAVLSSFITGRENEAGLLNEVGYVDPLNNYNGPNSYSQIVFSRLNSNSKKLPYMGALYKEVLHQSTISKTARDVLYSSALFSKILPNREVTQ